MKKGNIGWVNTIKVLCMILIYLNHSEIYCGTDIGLLRNIYLPIFVPAFFFISGYLLFMKQMKEPLVTMRMRDWTSVAGGGKHLIISILYKIAIPSILFSILIYFPKIILRGQSFELSDFLIQTLGGCSYWFTSALTLAELIIVLLLLSRCKNICFYVVVGVLSAFIASMAFRSGITITDNPNFPWFWKGALNAVFYLSLGGLYVKYEDVLERKLSIDKWITIVSVVYVCYCLFDFRAYNGGNYSCPITIQSALLSMTGILSLIYICKKVPATKFSDYWGRNTLGLYFVCGAIPNTIAIILRKLMPVGIPMVLICWMLSFAVALVVVYFLNRYLPFMFDIRKLRIKHNEI